MVDKSWLQIIINNSGPLSCTQAWHRSCPGGAAAFEGGIDLSAPNGTPVTALADGQVIGAGTFVHKDTGLFGGGVLTTRVRTPDGQVNDLFYQHLKLSPHIKFTTLPSKQIIHQGEVIGVVDFGHTEVGCNAEWGGIWGSNHPNSWNPNPEQYIRYLIQLSGGPTSFGPLTSANNTLNANVLKVHAALNNVPGISGLAIALDDLEQFTPYNPVPQSISSSSGSVDTSETAFKKAQQKYNPNGINFCFGADNNCDCIYNSDYGAWVTCKQLEASNPGGISVGINATSSQTVQAVVQFITGNIVAFIIRALITLVGILLLYAMVLNLTSSITKEEEGTVTNIIGGGSTDNASTIAKVAEVA